MDISFLRILFGALVLPSLVLVLFSDLLPTLLGRYADQRLMLALIFGPLVATSVFSFFQHPSVSVSSAIKVSLPTLTLVFTFILLSLPSDSHNHLWVEPGMYSLFFLTIIFAGGWLAWSGIGASYASFLATSTAITCSVYGLASVSVYIFATLDGLTELTDFIPWGFVNIRYWSHVATWCLPLLPLAVLVGPLKGFRIWRMCVLLGAGMWWWILFLTSARGSALGVAFGVILVVFLFGRRVFPWIKVFLQYLLVGIVIWLLLSVFIPSFMESDVQVRSIKVDSSGRIILFVEAWKMSLQSFPFGMGPQSWLTHEPITTAYAHGKKFGHPHNMYLMWAAEYGWLLFMAIGLVVVQAIRNFWRRRIELFQSGSSRQLLLLAGFTASVSAALFHAGVSAVFMAPGSMLVGVFVLIAFWALVLPVPVLNSERLVSSASMNSSFRRIAVSIVTAIILGLWFLWLAAVWRYYQDMRLDEPYYLKNESGLMLPRFWFHGNFPRE